MPQNNSRGDFTHGTGGAFANVNNQAFSVGGSPGWIDDDTVGYVSGRTSDILPGGNWQAMKYHRPTRTFSPLSNPPSGGNHLFAGGGHASWWWGTNDPLAGGLYSTTGFRSRLAGLLGMGPDAAIGYKPDYQSMGPTRVRELDGRDWLLTEGHAYDLCMLGNGRAVWMEGFTLRSVGFDTPPLYTAEGGIWKPCAAFAGGKWWISYFSGKHGIVLHPFDSFDGFHVLRKGNGWHTISALGPDTIRATVSSGIAEQAGQIWGLDYHVLTGEVTEITSGARVADAEERVDIRTINAFDLTPTNRPLWLGFFEFGSGPASPGNCTLAVRNLSGQQVRPVLVTDETVGKVFGKIPGYWLGGDTVERIEAFAASIARSGYPPVAYWDARRWPRLPNLPKGSWLALQAYCGASEHPDDFEQDLRRVLGTIPPTQKVALVAQCYTSNLSLTTNLRALVPVYNRLALDFKNIVAVLPFTGAGRATGLPDHPEVRGLWEEFAAGIPSAPPIEEIMQPPRFTISEPKFPITGTFAPGRPFEMRCVATLEAGAGEPDWIEWQYSEKGTGGPWIAGAHNPGFDKDHTFRITKAGTFWFRAVASNSAGTHMTGLERKVTITAEGQQPEQPKPEPTKTGPVPLPSYDQFVKVEGPEIDKALGARPNLSQVLHTAWRRLNENWTHANVLAGVRNQPLSPEHDQRQRLAAPTYDEWTSQEGPAIIAALKTASPGDLRHNAFRRFVEGWTLANIIHDIKHEPLEAPQKPPKPRARTGVVVPDGRAVRDDLGGFHPLGMTFFWAMQGWKNERDHFVANAKWVASKGFDYVRMLTEVGWAGREIDPTAPQWSDWGTVLREVMDYLYNDLGLRMELTLLGKGTSTDPIWLARQVGDIVAENRQHMVMNFETCNEYGPDLSVLKAMARELKARVPNIIALSSGDDAPGLKQGALDTGISGFTAHTDRGTGDHKWRQVRQPYDFKEFRPLVLFANEPPGPASSVATNDNPLQLAMLRAVGVMCGGAGFVLHTGTGVFGDGKPHPTAGPRPANFWEIDNIDAIVDAVKNVSALLPEGVENWQVANTQWVPPNPVAPFQPHNHWEGDTGDGVNKAYSALSPDGRIIQMPCGVRGHVSMKASYNLSEVTVYDPLTMEKVVENASFAKDDIMDLPGGGTDAMKAYIIHGRR